VNQIGLKALQHFADQRNVAQKRGVEAQVFFQSKGEKAARQLQRPNIAVLRDGLSAVARAWRLVWATPFTSWKESGK
jgi:hypothetical protein